MPSEIDAASMKESISGEINLLNDLWEKVAPNVRKIALGSRREICMFLYGARSALQWVSSEFGKDGNDCIPPWLFALNEFSSGTLKCSVVKRELEKFLETVSSIEERGGE